MVPSRSVFLLSRTTGLPLIGRLLRDFKRGDSFSAHLKTTTARIQIMAIRTVEKLSQR